MIPALVSLFLIAGLTGLGRTLVWALRLPDHGTVTTLAVSWWLGYGCYGWLAFFLGIAGMLEAGWVALPAAAGLAGLGLMRPRLPDREGAATLVLFLLLGAMSLPAAVVPPAEADSLAYHFALPKLFSERGEIFFQAIAVDAAVPLLTHAVSAAAHALAGERGMLLVNWWAGLMAILMVHGLAGRILRCVGRGLVAALFFTVPATIYSATSGTVELRLTGLFLLGVFVLLEYRTAPTARKLAAVALAAGWVAAAKYFGLFGTAILGLWSLLEQRLLSPGTRLRHLLLFGVIASIAGSQWYLWNAYHTGTPVFPILYKYLGYFGWSAEQQAFFTAEYLAPELMIARDLLSFLVYPFAVLLDGEAFDSGRTGFGMVFMFCLGTGVAGLLSRRIHCPRRAIDDRERLFLVACSFYALWFLVGTSGRIRHLLPVLPLLMIVAAAVIRDVRDGAPVLLRRGLDAAVAFVLVVQIGILALVVQPALAVILGATSRIEYLEANVAHYAATRHLNETLPPDAKVMVSAFRTMNYYLERDYLYAFPAYQEIVPLRPGAAAAAAAALARHGITHTLIHREWLEREPWASLQRNGCLVLAETFDGWVRESRTDWTAPRAPVTYVLLQRAPCGAATAGVSSAGAE